MKLRHGASKILTPPPGQNMLSSISPTSVCEFDFFWGLYTSAFWVSLNIEINVIILSPSSKLMILCQNLKSLLKQWTIFYGNGISTMLKISTIISISYLFSFLEKTTSFKDGGVVFVHLYGTGKLICPFKPGDFLKEWSHNNIVAKCNQVDFQKMNKFQILNVTCGKIESTLHFSAFGLRKPSIFICLTMKGHNLIFTIQPLFSESWLI